MSNFINLPKGMLQANSPIHVNGIGTVVSPLLKDIYSSELNMVNFMVVRVVSTGGTDEIINFLKATNSKINIPSETTKYQAFICSDDLVISFLQGLTLFVREKCIFDRKVGSFYFLAPDSEKVIGIFDENNFDVLCDVLRQCFHIRKETDENRGKQKEMSPELREIMSEFKKYENMLDNNSDYKNYTLENIISKLGVNSHSYTLMNIYDLTVWQLYNQFEAYRLGRQAHVVDRSYSIWGGEFYEDDLWLENIE